jgi:hypothetical protein
VRDRSSGTRIAQRARMRGTVILLALGACDLDLDFHSEATSINAVASSFGTTVSICAGPSELLSCNGNETFDVTVGDETQRAEEGFLSFGTQTASFAASAPGTPIQVVRLRDRADAFVELPEPLGLHVSLRGSRIELTWQPSAVDEMKWSSTLSCDGTGASYFGEEEDVEDDGELVISTDDLPYGERGLCHASVTLTRRRTGSIDQAFFDGSTIDGEQARTFTFDLFR